MKKKVVLLILSMSLVMLVACNNDNKTKERLVNKSSDTSSEIKTDAYKNDKTAIKTNGSDDKNVVFSEISHAELAFDPSIANLYESADFIIKGQVTENLEGKIYDMDWMPDTGYKVKVLDVLKGEMREDEIKVVIEGGRVSLKEYIEMTDKSTIKKQGLDKLSDEEIEGKFVDIRLSYDGQLQVGKEYIIFLYDKFEGYEEIGYTWIMSGYGIYELKDDIMRNELSANKESLETFKSKMEDGSYSKEATVEKLDREAIKKSIENNKEAK